jgi:hypothetical protein
MKDKHGETWTGNAAAWVVIAPALACIAAFLWVLVVNL